MSGCMIFQPLAELLPLKGQGRLAGLDIGDRTIGVALSDTTWTIATPLHTHKRNPDSAKPDVASLNSLIDGYQVTAFIFGWPRQMSGDEGIQCQKVEGLAQVMRKSIALPFFQWDERFSTSAVTRTLDSANMSHRKQKKVVDQLAATFILQGVLDWLR